MRFSGGKPYLSTAVTPLFLSQGDECRRVALTGDGALMPQHRPLAHLLEETLDD